MVTHDSEQLGEWLSAYADGELDAVEAQRVEAILQESDEARRMLDELRRTASLVATLPRHDAPPSILEELRLRAEREELLGGLEPEPVAHSGGRGWVTGILSSAAVLAILAVGGWYLTMGGSAALPREDSVVALAPSSENEKSDIAHRTSRAARRRRFDARTKKSTRHVVGGKTKSPIGAYSFDSVADQDETADTLLAAATIDQKLRAGLDVTAVRAHAFANEPVRLEVEVAGAAERDRVIAHMETYLSERRVAEVSAKRERTSSSPPRRFFYAGAPGKNFAGAEDREILVRATKGDLLGLVQQAAEVTGREDGIVLVSGPLKILGSRQAQRTLDGLAPSPGAAGRTSTEGYAAGTRDAAESPSLSVERKLSAAPDQFLQSLIDMLGLDDTATFAAPEVTGATPASIAKVPTDGGAKDGRVLADFPAPSSAKKTEKEQEPTTDFDRPSLVTRRARALQESAGRRSREANARAPKRVAGKSAFDRHRPDLDEAASDESRAVIGEQVVTLVVRIRIAPPAGDRASSPAKRRSSRRPPAKTGKPTGKGNNKS